MNETPVISVKHLFKQYGDGCSHCQGGVHLEKNICPECHTVYALNDVSFDLYPGEIIGIVGESGSGKSTLMKSLYFDETPTSGEYYIPSYSSDNLLTLPSIKKRAIRNTQLGMVYQNPVLGLNMDFASITNIAEKLIDSGEMNVEKMRNIGYDLLQKVNIPVRRAKESPKNFSGGMQQRVQIAKALSNNPPLLLLDEITTGLDLSVQADVLDLIKVLQRTFGISMIVVSHDLAVIRMLSDRAFVMLNGRVIESGLTDAILEDPQHEYTQQLVYSLL
ncbi:ATP-binding cassette domain-containing protein [Macrococcus capreoli]|uniref:ATP-binding cassette domain-containing protein n=1 Tax=Macrococcus capreoli TaxID=2982690 RepID=UPI0021D5FDF7|nr:ATP-binding cassette domain-containing protein [Macrococcus sp. TMW 2.2395]MCU7556137.1 ATP-binding cassette domain-containing protein [Macrococcus sp. TMW 2.2395]